MTLTVVSVAYALAVVRPDTAGGAEQVLAALDRALVDAGHRSIVVALEGSCTAGTLVPVRAPYGTLDNWVRAAQHRRMRVVLAAELDRLERAGTPADVVHMHGLDFYDVLPPAGVPVLATLHLPPDWYPSDIWALGGRDGWRPDTYLHCVSEAQQRRCPAGAALLPPIPNGVPVPDHPPAALPRDYALCLGRICPEKGYHLAVDAAARAGVPLVIAGQLFPYETHQQYWAEELAPRVGRGRARFVGPVAGAAKARLLAGARCLVVPSLAEETSSLVAMEAAAAGTPVVAFRRGALPEIVVDGRTGYLCDDAAALAAGIARAGAIDRGACWAEARARFDERQMGARYLARYVALAAAARATAAVPAGAPAGAAARMAH
ncbi:glycosyl transferase family 1 [Gemmatimonadetes bacterium T265]|nr:glycosyl transferase family 1 [Gemmatimonadetes bacterium T265]